MTQSRLWLIVVITLAIALGAGVHLAGKQQASGPEPVADAYQRLLTTTLPDSLGKAQPLAQWQGKVLIINFWASWCPPCREEMPTLSRLQTKHAANGVQIVGIAIDSATNVTQYATRHPAAYPLLIGDSNTSELTRAMGNTQMALPYTVVFDASGAAKMTRLGLISENELDSILKGVTAQ